MKKILLVVLTMLIVTPLISQVSGSTKTGWRKESIISYCDEYDVMIGDGGYWIVNWDQSKNDIKTMLLRDGFQFQETDSTIEWTQTQIYSCNVKFNPLGKISYVNVVITVTPKHGPDIFNSLKNKHDIMHGDPGKFQSFDTSSGYTWLDNRCTKPIYTMLAKKLLQDNKYFITLFSSKIGN